MVVRRKNDYVTVRMSGHVTIDRRHHNYDRQMTRFADHQEQWCECVECPLGKTARKHVLGRGTLPADFLLIGEAPGNSENALGVPFIGPAGKVLDALLEDCLPPRATFFITNVLACIPFLGDPMDAKFRKPEKEEADKCRPRVQEIASIATPRCIITLGEVAKKFAPPKLIVPHSKGDKQTINWFHVRHPSWILRNGGIGSVAYKKERDSLKRFAYQMMGLEWKNE